MSVIPDYLAFTIVCHSSLSVIYNCLSSLIIYHLVLSAIPHYLSFTIVCHTSLPIIYYCLSYLIICHLPLSVITHYLSFRIVCHPWLFVFARYNPMKSVHLWPFVPCAVLGRIPDSLPDWAPCDQSPHFFKNLKKKKIRHTPQKNVHFRLFVPLTILGRIPDVSTTNVHCTCTHLIYLFIFLMSGIHLRKMWRFNNLFHRPFKEGYLTNRQTTMALCDQSSFLSFF